MPHDHGQEDDVAVVHRFHFRGGHDALYQVPVLQVGVVIGQAGGFFRGAGFSGSAAAAEVLALLLDDVVHGAAVVVQVRGTEVEFQLADHGQLGGEGLLVADVELVQALCAGEGEGVFAEEDGEGFGVDLAADGEESGVGPWGRGVGVERVDDEVGGEEGADDVDFWDEEGVTVDAGADGGGEEGEEVRARIGLLGGGRGGGHAGGWHAGDSAFDASVVYVCQLSYIQHLCFRVYRPGCACHVWILFYWCVELVCGLAGWLQNRCVYVCV